MISLCLWKTASAFKLFYGNAIAVCVLWFSYFQDLLKYSWKGIWILLGTFPAVLVQNWIQFVIKICESLVTSALILAGVTLSLVFPYNMEKLN